MSHLSILDMRKNIVINWASKWQYYLQSLSYIGRIERDHVAVNAGDICPLEELFYGISGFLVGEVIYLRRPDQRNMYHSQYWQVYLMACWTSRWQYSTKDTGYKNPKRLYLCCKMQESIMRSRITVKAQKWLKTIFVSFELFGTMPNNVKIAD